MLDGKSVTISPVSEKGQDARMTRRRVLILAAIVATLLLAAEFYGPFAFQRSAGYGRGWGTCADG